MYLFSWDESGANNSKESEEAFCETKEYLWRENKDYVGGATCWSSNWL